MMTFPVYQTKNENKILQNMVNDYSILVKIHLFPKLAKRVHQVRTVTASQKHHNSIPMLYIPLKDKTFSLSVAYM